MIPELGLSVRNLALKMGMRAGETLEALRAMGAEELAAAGGLEEDEDGWYPEDEVLLDLNLADETCELLVMEMGMVPLRLVPKVPDAAPSPRPANDEEWLSLPARAPVVTVMGHVDHGKTTLLDKLRNVDKPVAGTEAGGITQAIGAFRVAVSSDVGYITVIDTPGHEAFSAMRERGGAATDVIVLVIAVTEGLKPTTRDVIALARATEAIVVVALTKVDMHGGNEPLATTIEKIETELFSEGVKTESMGGDVQVVPCSGVTGEGVDDLLEAIALQAELSDPPLRAATRPFARIADERAAGAEGDEEGDEEEDEEGEEEEEAAAVPVTAEAVVLEAATAKGLGVVLTALVRWGELVVGDCIVAGTQWGRVRALTDEQGGTLKRAGPSTPVLVSGLRGIPHAGQVLLVVDNERRAQDVAEMRAEREQWEADEEEELAAMEVKRLAEKEAAEVAAEAGEGLQGWDAIKAGRDAKKAAMAALVPQFQYGFGGKFGAAAKGQGADVNDGDEELDDDALTELMAKRVEWALDEAHLGTDGLERGKTFRDRRRKSARALEAARRTRAEHESKELRPGDVGYVAPRVPVVMKCDSDGMLSVLKEAIAALPSKVVHAQVVLAAVGDVTSGDVTFAETVGAPIFVFGSAKVPGPVRKEALNKSVGFHFHKVIYHFEEALKTVLVEGQPPAMVPKVTGEAEVLQLFEISGKRRSQQHLVVGCNVTKGELARKAHYRVLRPRRDDSGERDIVHEAKEADSLRHFKESVELVAKGQECGVGLDNADCKEGDFLQAYELEPLMVDIYGEPIKTAAAGKKK